jgi:hypothetical protein
MERKLKPNEVRFVAFPIIYRDNDERYRPWDKAKGEYIKYSKPVSYDKACAAARLLNNVYATVGDCPNNTR